MALYLLRSVLGASDDGIPVPTLKALWLTGDAYLNKQVQWSFVCTVIELCTGQRGVNSVGSGSGEIYWKAL